MKDPSHDMSELRLLNPMYLPKQDNEIAPIFTGPAVTVLHALQRLKNREEFYTLVIARDYAKLRLADLLVSQIYLTS